MPMRLPIFPLLSVILLGLNSAAQADIELKQENNRISVIRNGKLVTQYRSDTHVPCLYPVIGPTGTKLTRNFPLKDGFKNEERDHPHHVSLWYTHGKVNGLDFWTTEHDPDCKIKHLGFEKSNTTSKNVNGVSTDTASFTVNLAWNQKDKTLLKETRTYSFLITDDALNIEVSSSINAPEEDVTFGNTKEGSFAIRLTPSLRLKGKVAKGHILNSEGDKDEKAWGKRASWVAYEGPDSEGNDVTVVMFDHPKNLRFPTWWHARDYGLLAANPFGQHAFEGTKDVHDNDFLLKKGSDFTQNYRILFQKGTMSAEEITESFTDFSKE